MAEEAGGTTIEFALGTARILLQGWGLLAPDGVHPASEALQRRTDEFAAALGIEQVDVQIWPHDRPDAIPVGTRSGGRLILTSGLLDLLDEDTLDAAIAHELAHIRLAHAHKFGAFMLTGGTMLATLVASTNRRGSRLILSAGGAAIGVLSLLALTRRYERQADRLAVDVIDDPDSLERALLIVRTRDSTIDPRCYQAPEPSALQRLLALYPPPNGRVEAAMED